MEYLDELKFDFSKSLAEAEFHEAKLNLAMYLAETLNLSEKTLRNILWFSMFQAAALRDEIIHDEGIRKSGRLNKMNWKTFRHLASKVEQTFAQYKLYLS